MGNSKNVNVLAAATTTGAPPLGPRRIGSIVPLTVTPGEDADDFARRAAAFRAEVGVAGSFISAVVAERLAVLSFRLERCVQHEAAMTAYRVREAIADFDQARRDEAYLLLDALEVDPVGNHARLAATPEGVNLLESELGKLRQAAAGESVRWTAGADAQLDRCTGRVPASPIEPQREVLMARIDAELAKLAATRGTHDLAAIARARAEVADRALVSVTPESIAARKVEVETERSIDRSLRTLDLIRRHFEVAPGPAPRAAVVVPAASRPTPPTAAPPTAGRPTPATRPTAEPEAALGSFRQESHTPGWPNEGLTLTAGKPLERPASRYDDRKKRPRIDR